MPNRPSRLKARSVVKPDDNLGTEDNFRVAVRPDAQPWHVALYYRLSALDTDFPPELDGHPVEFFIRAPTQMAANRSARMLWVKQIKCKVARESDEYPMLMDRSDLTVLDDQDFAEQWRAAQGCERRFWYPQDWVKNPIGFVYFPDGKIIDSLDSGKIIIPT